MRRLLCLLPLLALTGCVKMDDFYAPPEQRRPFELAPVHGLSHFIVMNGRDAPAHIVSGVVPDPDQNNPWRWCLERAEFRFGLRTTRGLRLRAEVGTPDITMKDTGPLTIRTWVENHLLLEHKFDQPGNATLQQEVPEEWLTTAVPVRVRLEVDKVWVSPQDGARRGFLLSKVGFVQ